MTLVTLTVPVQTSLTMQALHFLAPFLGFRVYRRSDEPDAMEQVALKLHSFKEHLSFHQSCQRQIVRCDSNLKGDQRHLPMSVM